ncbi:MAG TPA: polyphenol oxidase family protein, partial [Desulfobacteria bacterium]|nr:polyphenol oxidase family protein [Desulfobacteria bacterium]
MKPLPHIVQSPLLRSVPWAYHAFLGVDPVEGRGRRERLREVFSLSAAVVGTLKQVHSASVLSFEAGDGDVPGGWKREGDALWTRSPGTGVGVHTADCVPILLAHRKIPVGAAVHAGWRGLAAGIVEETVRVLAARFGDTAVGEIVAVAGPCARGCCYEIGEETAEALRGLPGESEFLKKGKAPGKWTADL